MLAASQAANLLVDGQTLSHVSAKEFKAAKTE